MIDYTYNEADPLIPQDQDGNLPTGTSALSLWRNLLSNNDQGIKAFHGRVPGDDDKVELKKIKDDDEHHEHYIHISDDRIITAVVCVKSAESNDRDASVTISGKIYESEFTLTSRSIPPSDTCTFDVYIFSRLREISQTFKKPNKGFTLDIFEIWRRYFRDGYRERVRPGLREHVRNKYRVHAREKCRQYSAVILFFCVVALGVLINLTFPSSTKENGTFPSSTKENGTLSQIKPQKPYSNSNHYPPKSLSKNDPNGKAKLEDIRNGRGAEIGYVMDVTSYLNSSIHGTKKCFVIPKWLIDVNGSVSVCYPTYHPDTPCNFVSRLRLKLDLQWPLENDPGNKLRYHRIFEVSGVYQHGVCKKLHTFPRSKTVNMKTSGDVGFSIYAEYAP